MYSKKKSYFSNVIIFNIELQSGEIREKNNLIYDHIMSLAL